MPPELDARLSRIETQLHGVSQVGEMVTMLRSLDEALRGGLEDHRPGLFRRVDRLGTTVEDHEARIVDLEEVNAAQARTISEMDRRLLLAESAVKLAADLTERTAKDVADGLKSRLTWHQALMTSAGLAVLVAFIATVADGVRRAAGWK